MAITIGIMLLGLLSSSLAAGIGTAWDISPLRSSLEETTPSSWPRLDLSAFEVRSISGTGHLANKNNPEPSTELESSGESSKNVVASEAEDMLRSEASEILYDYPIFRNGFKSSKKDVEILPGSWEKFRRGRTGRRREFCPDNPVDAQEPKEERRRLRRSAEEPQLEKVSATKNVREPRLGSPEAWSTQPLAVEFRHRANIDGVSTESTESSRSGIRSHQPPQVDFVTSNRRSFDARESRELPMAKYNDDGYYRTVNTFRDYDVPFSRGYYYPDHFRTERDYFVRGVNEPAPFVPDRYRGDDYDMYRSRPTTKPKRITYYAILPEIVRKPVDLRSYGRPYDTVGRNSASASMGRDGPYKRMPSAMDSRYQYKNYPYGSYDNYDDYTRRPMYPDRSYMPYNDRVEGDRYREQDLDHASFKSAPRSEDGAMGASDAASARQEKEQLPWPVQIGTEVNIKDNQRVSGRKIYGQYQDFERLRPQGRTDREENRTAQGLSEDRN